MALHHAQEGALGFIWLEVELGPLIASQTSQRGPLQASMRACRVCGEVFGPRSYFELCDRLRYGGAEGHNSQSFASN